MRGFFIILLLALLVIMTIYSGIFSGKKEIKNQVLNTDNKIDAMLIETDIKRIAEAINAFYSDKGEYPEEIADLSPTYLRTERESRDPWGLYYQIKIENGINVFVISAGKDKKSGTSDDLKRRLE